VAPSPDSANGIQIGLRGWNWATYQPSSFSGLSDKFTLHLTGLGSEAARRSLGGGVAGGGAVGPRQTDDDGHSSKRWLSQLPGTLPPRSRSVGPSAPRSAAPSTTARSGSSR